MNICLFESFWFLNRNSRLQILILFIFNLATLDVFIEDDHFQRNHYGLVAERLPRLKDTKPTESSINHRLFYLSVFYLNWKSQSNDVLFNERRYLRVNKSSNYTNPRVVNNFHFCNVIEVHNWSLNRRV